MKSPTLRAFTLVELLSVVAIIGVLAGILIPLVSRSRDMARNTQCMSNLRGLHAVALLWSTDNEGRLPDARRWGYNEGSSTAVYKYQLSPYLSMRATKGVAWGDAPSSMKCDSAFALKRSTQEWGRTYGINTYATSTLDGEARAASSGYPARMSWIPHPAKMVFFMDGAVSATSGSYQTNVSGAFVQPDHATPFGYPHGDAINLVFLDGRVERIDRAAMIAGHADSNSSFWRFDR